MDKTDVENKTVSAYKAAHLHDLTGYQSINHNFIREDVILHMYEIMLLFRKAFIQCSWNGNELKNKKVLEVGCAWGFRLNQLMGFSIKPQNMFGIDLIPEYIEEAREFNNLINYEVMSATKMSFNDKTMDFSFAVMALSAMLDEEVITKSLNEMCRVSKEFVIVIDNFNPEYQDERNGAVYFKGVNPEHIYSLATREDVDKVIELGEFWTTSSLAWKIYKGFNKLGLDSIAYALAIRFLAKHSHRGFMIITKEKEK